MLRGRIILNNRLFEPKQWLKNIFVFAPLFFGSHLFTHDYLFWSCAIFIAFCLLSSSAYRLNIVLDSKRKNDLPSKKDYIVIIATLLLSIAFPLFIDMPGIISLFSIMGVYYVMSILYSLWLKELAIIDVIVVSMGYVLRILAGGVIGIEISHWIVLMTFLLALFVELHKCRIEVIKDNETDKCIYRKHGYNETFINFSMAVVLSITLVCYIMYSISDEVVNRFSFSYIYLTTLWVIIAMFRVIQRSLVYKVNDGIVSILFKDKLILISILCWIISFTLIIYK